MEKEFNLSENLWEDEHGIMHATEDEIKEFIKRNIGCGIKMESGWICGDFLEQEQNEDTGEWMGQRYYCDRCNKLIKEAGDKLIK